MQYPVNIQYNDEETQMFIKGNVTLKRIFKKVKKQKNIQKDLDELVAFVKYDEVNWNQRLEELSSDSDDEYNIIIYPKCKPQKIESLENSFDLSLSASENEPKETPEPLGLLSQPPSNNQDQFDKEMIENIFKEAQIPVKKTQIVSRVRNSQKFIDSLALLMNSLGNLDTDTSPSQNHEDGNLEFLISNLNSTSLTSNTEGKKMDNLLNCLKEFQNFSDLKIDTANIKNKKDLANIFVIIAKKLESKIDSHIKYKSKIDKSKKNKSLSEVEEEKVILVDNYESQISRKKFLDSESTIFQKKPEVEMLFSKKEFNKRLDFIRDFFDEDDLSDQKLRQIVLEYQTDSREDFKSRVIEDCESFLN